MKKSLLEIAKEAPRGKGMAIISTKEKCEVCVAFLYRNISWKQLTTVMPEIHHGKTTNYGAITKIIRDGIANGWVSISMEK